MGFIRKDGFQFMDGFNSDSIVIESDNLDEYIKYINSKKVKSIYITPLDYNLKDINFLDRCYPFEKINISEGLINDYSGLNSQKALKTLYLGNPTGKVNLAKFNTLEVLSIDYNKNVSGIEECGNLKTLWLSKFKPKSSNLESISSLNKIESLRLIQPNITSLKGLGELTNLKRLALDYSRLEVIDEIEKNSKTLRSLRFEYCKNIKNHEYCTRINGLELLAFDHCREIPSINFINELPKLRAFIFVDTNIVDGDLSPCTRLDFVGTFNKKHYSHKSEEFKKSDDVPKDLFWW